MRFYVSGGDDNLSKIINRYEKKSYKVCELCGKPGELMVRKGWYKTLCQKDSTKNGYISLKERDELREK